MKPMISDDGTAMPIELYMNVNSSNPELPPSLDNNNVNIKIPVYVETDIVIRG